jgi:dipeptidyl aminopeptidase/acylaminoacyl peptidase
MSLFAARFLLVLTVLPAGLQGQTASPSSAEAGQIQPEVKIATGDYWQARQSFRTKLLTRGPSPRPGDSAVVPDGVSEVDFASGSLRLKGWLRTPSGTATRSKRPAVLFLHGGFAFGLEDWTMTQPYQDSGFIVMVPQLRGENGQAGVFSLFYDEVDDVLAAIEFLRGRKNVDRDRIFLAGHSVGGTLAMLAALSTNKVRAAASFSGSPDQVIYVRHGIPPEFPPFDRSDPREFEMRSPLAYASSFKIPTRIYLGAREPHFRLSSERTADIARKAGHDVEVVVVPGSHMSAVPAEMLLSIAFFRKVASRKR